MIKEQVTKDKDNAWLVHNFFSLELYKMSGEH